eukprot:NODE_12205_length_238_cov_71.698413_g10435_i0.p2 GENE.NODE_12205_length_238_cov_71.698413_g10435_i0~~NODE_12205_length_238_cov_71.698413_g10435_i0.p2  ORF type:complete len:67 (-),score=28.47 NODE_12205_length_238_cov_71.698413_g10435_i0:36-215(-)
MGTEHRKQLEAEQQELQQVRGASSYISSLKKRSLDTGTLSSTISSRRYYLTKENSSLND